MDVQIFGTPKSKDSQKAIRFFKERGLKPHVVDLRQRAISPGELRRFAQKFGLENLVDTAGKAYRDAGLEYLRLDDETLAARLIDDPRLMVQPLIRAGNALGLGWDEGFWRDWHDAHKDAPSGA